MAPEEHRAWLEPLTLERPMPDDDTTLKLRAVLTSLGGRRPREFLDSDQGKQVLWDLLQAASAWL